MNINLDELIITKQLDVIVKKALDDNIIELGVTSYGPVGFVINGFTPTDIIPGDVSDKTNALCIDAIWYATDDYDDESDDGNIPDDLDNTLTVDEIRQKYDNTELAIMIAETFDAMDTDVATELVSYLVSVTQLL